MKKFLQKSMIIFYVFDIFLNLNLSYYDNGEIICDKKTISLQYFRKDFFFDVITLIFFSRWLIEIEDSYVAKELVILYFLKVSKIKQIIKDFEELLVTEENYFHIFSLIILLLRIFIVSHLSACLWHYIGSLAYAENWLQTKGIINMSWSIRYLYSFYFIVISMNTVGYGDIVPQNPLEILFCIICVILGCLMFAYGLNCMGTIFHSFYKKERELKEELFIINDFMKSKKIPHNFQMKIRKYLQYVWTSEKQLNNESSRVFQKLSKSLQLELLFEAYGAIIKKIEMISSNFSAKTLREIIRIMKEENYPPGEIIFPPRDNKNHDMFFIKKGNVEIFVENDMNDDIQNQTKVLKLLGESSIFGEIAFFSDMARTAGARSKDYTTLIRFDQNEFNKIVEDCDEDKEKLSYIRDEIKFYHNYDDLMIRCYGCNQRNHLVHECPLIHSKVLKDIVLAKYNYSENQKRRRFDRSMRKKKIFHESDRPKNVQIRLQTLAQIRKWEHEDDENESIVENSEVFLNESLENSSSFNEEIPSKKSIRLSCFSPELRSNVTIFASNEKIEEVKKEENTLKLFKNSMEGYILGDFLIFKIFFMIRYPNQ